MLHAEVAREFGYREPVDRYVLQGLTPAQQSAYSGEDGAGGCLATAQARLGQRSLNESALLPEVKAAKARWSECMRARGLDYREPYAAATDPAWYFGNAQPTERERAVALADAGCKGEVGLASTWVRAEADVQERLISQHAASLRRIQQGNDKVLAVADPVLRD